MRKAVPMQDRGNAQHGDKGYQSQNTRFDPVPLPAQQYTGKEVDSPCIGRAQHHGRHRRLNFPGKQFFSLTWQNVQDHKSGQKKRDHKSSHPTRFPQNSICFVLFFHVVILVVNFSITQQNLWLACQSHPQPATFSSWACSSIVNPVSCFRLIKNCITGVEPLLLPSPNEWWLYCRVFFRTVKTVFIRFSYCIITCCTVCKTTCLFITKARFLIGGSSPGGKDTPAGWQTRPRVHQAPAIIRRTIAASMPLFLPM